MAGGDIGEADNASPEQFLTRRKIIVTAGAIAVATAAALYASKTGGTIPNLGRLGELFGNAPTPSGAGNQAPNVASAIPSTGGAPKPTEVPGASEAIAAHSNLSEAAGNDTVSEATLDYMHKLGLQLPEGHGRAVINEVSKRVVEFNGLTGSERSLPIGQQVNYPSREVLEQWMADALKKATS